MIQQTAIRLVKSLSGSEKRFFKVHTREQTGDKYYITLFEIIDRSSSSEAEPVKQKFKQLHPKVSFDSTARYLVKILTDCLIQSKADKDPFFDLLHGMMRIKVLAERSLPEAAITELKKVRLSARHYQQHLIEYMTYREELNYLADANFQGVSDQVLVERQSKAKDSLKSLNHIQDHHTLFELLKYRLVHSGKVAAADEKKQLNDLMLSEMILLTGKSRNSFDSQKLHLLFQSFFFTDIGDYKSALKIFRSLNELFEQNIELLNHPPLDYLSTLSGILDSLYALENYEQTSFYLEKVQQLDHRDYPEYFRYLVRKTVIIYELAILTREKKFQEAVDHIAGFEANWINAYAMVDEEKQWEVYFYCSLSYYGIKNWKLSHKFISEVMQTLKGRPQWLICKATRLLNIIIYFEKGDVDYLQYEIRSYKRFFSQHHKLLKSETLLLKFLSNWTGHKRKKVPELQLKKITTQISGLQTDPYEKQLLKYFDFAGWIKSKFG